MSINSIPQEGLLAEYTFDDVEGQVIHDTSGNGYDITGTMAFSLVPSRNGIGRGPIENIPAVGFNFGAPPWIAEIHEQPFSISIQYSLKKHPTDYTRLISFQLGGPNDESPMTRKISIRGSSSLIVEIGRHAVNDQYTSGDFELIVPDYPDDINSVILTSTGVGQYSLYINGVYIDDLEWLNTKPDVTDPASYSLNPPIVLGANRLGNVGEGLCNCDQIRIYNRPLDTEEIEFLAAEENILSRTIRNMKLNGKYIWSAKLNGETVWTNENAKEVALTSNVNVGHNMLQNNSEYNTDTRPWECTPYTSNIVGGEWRLIDVLAISYSYNHIRGLTETGLDQFTEDMIQNRLQLDPVTGRLRINAVPANNDWGGLIKFTIAYHYESRFEDVYIEKSFTIQRVVAPYIYWYKPGDINDPHPLTPLANSFCVVGSSVSSSLDEQNLSIFLRGNILPIAEIPSSITVAGFPSMAVIPTSRMFVPTPDFSRESDVYFKIAGSIIPSANTQYGWEGSKKNSDNSYPIVLSASNQAGAYNITTAQANSSSLTWNMFRRTPINAIPQNNTVTKTFAAGTTLTAISASSVITANGYNSMQNNPPVYMTFNLSEIIGGGPSAVTETFSMRLVYNTSIKAFIFELSDPTRSISTYFSWTSNLWVVNNPRQLIVGNVTTNKIDMMPGILSRKAYRGSCTITNNVMNNQELINARDWWARNTYITN